MVRPPSDGTLRFAPGATALVPPWCQTGPDGGPREPTGADGQEALAPTGPGPEPRRHIRQHGLQSPLDQVVKVRILAPQLEERPAKAGLSLSFVTTLS